MSDYKMPKVTGEFPKGGFLMALYGVGKAMPLPRGATLFIVEDAEDDSTWVPVVIDKISRKKLTFRCACGKPSCTRVMTYNLTVQGRHL